MNNSLTTQKKAPEKPSRKILIVGGVAGGASCAARLRRLDERAEITIFERGPFVSFANCGLPYHIGDVIAEEESLVLANPEIFWTKFRIRVLTGHEVLSIDRAARSVSVKELAVGRIFDESYDALVLAPGATALHPPIPGLSLPGVFTVRTIPDSRSIRQWLENRQARRAVVAGGGFIGLEMAENLHHRGLEVSLMEMAPQILPPMDPEMVRPLENLLRTKGIHLHLGEAVQRIDTLPDGTLQVTSGSGTIIGADIVISALGVRPEVHLAKNAALDLGTRGGIRTDEQMRTSDPHIWAVGDAVEVWDNVLKTPTLLALAGPANRQGRLAADSICGRPVRFRGAQGTAICGLFGMAAGATGASEKALQRAGWQDFAVVHLHPKNHVGYYPGAETIHCKLIFQKEDGRILGFQAVGTSDVARKIDTVAAMIPLGGTVYDLEEVELCYAPQYGAAKDALNFAGMIASNFLRGDAPLRPWDTPEKRNAENLFLLDVREEQEFAAGHVKGATWIPLDELRSRLEELPRTRPIGVYCAAGQRGYYATRLLTQEGFTVWNYSGGWQTHQALQPHSPNK